jgi:hypothetical protein
MAERVKELLPACRGGLAAWARSAEQVIDTLQLQATLCTKHTPGTRHSVRHTAIGPET